MTKSYDTMNRVETKVIEIEVVNEFVRLTMLICHGIYSDHISNFGYF